MVIYHEWISVECHINLFYLLNKVIGAKEEKNE